MEITIKEMVVNEAAAELKRMLAELREELTRAATIEQMINIQNEIDDVRAALEDCMIHRDHYIKYGFIYQ